jgi:protein-L-isoaspartate(D-aspartate) O-methyltransferase
MTELLISHTKDRGKIFNNVLELGTGCGYQSAVLSYFCENIYSVERIKPLVSKARENLAALKIRNIEIIHGDGFTDWDKNKKYDGVICAAAPREYPHELVNSLNLSAKIVLPVGNSSNQKLNVITKISEDEILEESFEDVSFVPMLPGKSFDGSEL